MALGTLPAAKLLYSNFVVFHVLPKLFIAAKVVLQAVMNIFIVSTACQVNLGFVMAFDAPAHRKGWFGEFNQAGIFIHQLVDVFHFSNTADRICLDITVAILTLQASYNHVLLVTKEYVIRQIVDLVPTNRLSLI